MKIYRAHLDVVCCVVMLSVVVSKVGVSMGPFNGELTLVDSITDPVKPHVHRLRAFQFVVTVGKATGSGIVSGDFGGARLFMAKFLEDLPKEHCLLAIVEEGSYLGFSSRRHDMSHDARFNMDRTVGFGER